MMEVGSLRLQIDHAKFNHLLLRKALQILACLAVSTHIIYLLCMWGIAIAMFSMLSRQSMKAVWIAYSRFQL